ncbi:MBL fold metallo-hydrolase [Desertivirga xinjiangensis]|uniref:MBL fold metallo-hydrolase n=1 Tax=Desertivirga xinjiangensis TaxID=539206 RepID=UPI00210D5EAF|nr:MBL fold metallo-hydrolase [Pedobacter xinjiangensis]
MVLKIINSNSAGNCYILENNKEALIIEGGVKFPLVKQTLNFNISKVVGCIVSHEHGDHAKAVEHIAAAGINVYASAGTISGFECKSHRFKPVPANKVFRVGSFEVTPFNIMHDTNEPFGFLINHEETGKVLFLTDTKYCKYTFDGLNNIIIEANYSEEILNSGGYGEWLKTRVINSHMSLETCKGFLRANDLSQVNNIVLIHLSDSNSDERLFSDQIQELSCCNITVAYKNQVIPFLKTPF